MSRLDPKKIAEMVRSIAQPIVERMGLEIFDVKYRIQSGRWTLTVIIDKLNDYVSTRDCEMVSHELEQRLDGEDIIPGSYFLEVSSPGMDRPLRNIAEFSRFVGEYAKVKTDKTYRGHIKSVNVEKQEIILDVDGKDVLIKYEDVRSANLEVEF
ncbi:MAG TPA: ribosome maturation factor RimP [Fervidobacterium sp.]|nr:ribosome maturation factor RimP [Fervidobacterium sp.]HOH52878.1 ribosome maturation factor RimP [Fervidobacterium sp.]HOV54336.1 ribosome maturation factor RimP [Fervidobacterium sp.]HPC24336.1 ribosome maturation factor RimP [Fervidobacterium sp.]HQO05596.1 ribosome maturation factor RimP [Fervidobacterium sp.]